MQHRGFYFLVLISLVIMVLLSLGSGFWGGESNGRHFTEQLFSGVCHQMPDRSYHINGKPMAVNSRCFGIFAGLFISWSMIPLFNRVSIKKTVAIVLLLFAAGLQIIDYTGNLFQIWENTNHSRVVLGGFLGLVSFLVIADLFHPKIKNK